MDEQPELAVAIARESDLDSLVSLEEALFRDDAGVHDPDVDVDWPAAHGHEDFSRLLSNERACVLIAQADGVALGHLVGYLTEPSQVRRGQFSGVIRSLYVVGHARRRRVADALVTRFIGWAAGEHGASSISVTAYHGNQSARGFYEHLGFRTASVVLSRHVEKAR